jgi:hypothetical protein
LGEEATYILRDPLSLNTQASVLPSADAVSSDGKGALSSDSIVWLYAVCVHINRKNRSCFMNLD